MIRKYIYLVGALISDTLFRYKPFCFQFGKSEENHTSFAVGQALGWILLLLYIKRALKGKWEKLLYDVAFWCAISNLMDELFFDPLRLGLNEIIFFIFILTWTIVKSWRIKILI